MAVRGLLDSAALGTEVDQRRERGMGGAEQELGRRKQSECGERVKKVSRTSKNESEGLGKQSCSSL